jgi:TolB-like protein
MDALGASEVLLFAGFRLDQRGGGLFRRNEHGVFVPVAIGSRALGVLSVLVERRGDLVSKEEIVAAVWPGIVVEDSNLPIQISALRHILDQGRAEGSCIQTVAGRGYRFVATVTRRAADQGSSTAAVSSGGVCLPPRLSIAVLPFINLSRDPDQEYFADGITDDLTTDLSRISGSFVIARSTAFTYKGRAVEAKQIGRELGVRYVLEGSVRRSRDQIRVNTQLIDAETDAHLWAERFDRDMGDLFALQDDITSRIAVALNIELIAAEATRSTENPGALDYIFRGRAAGNKPPSKHKFAESISLFERALALDPRCIEAQSLLACQLMARVINGSADSAAADIARAEALAEQALVASPLSLLPHFAKGQVLRAQRCFAEAIPEYETVLAADRNSVQALHGLSQGKLIAGSIEEAIPLEEQAIRLSPRDPELGVWYLQIGQVHLLQSRTDDAILWLERACSAAPAHPGVRGALASAYALKGDTKRTSAQLAQARSLSGENRYASMAHLKAVSIFAVPTVRDLSEATYFAGLRKAGMPEE